MTNKDKIVKAPYRAPRIQAIFITLEHSVAAASSATIQNVTEQWEYTDVTQEQEIENFWK